MYVWRILLEMCRVTRSTQYALREQCPEGPASTETRGPRGLVSASRAGSLDLTTGKLGCQELLALHAMVAAPSPKTYDKGGECVASYMG